MSDRDKFAAAATATETNDVDNRGPAVVASGTVIGGFEFHGPFPTISAAHEWYEQQFFGGILKMPASIVLLAAPRPATTDYDAAPRAGSVTLTDAEREAVLECADIALSQLWSAREGGDEETIARWMQRFERITGLLARAVKEGDA
jgi:hypothetical protein